MAILPNRPTIGRREFLQMGAGLAASQLISFPAWAQAATFPDRMNGVDWDVLAEQLHGRLLAPRWPLADCQADPSGQLCADFFASARNPYFLGDDPALTQSFGWVDAWVSQPSERVVEAASAADVAAAVRFARTRGIRLAVKGGGHSYKGGSNAAGSLLIWTRRLNGIELHDGFTPSGSDVEPVPAVSVGAGAIWGDVYKEVCAGAGRYVQGGGCLTVGVAGLVQSGGFGSLSKAFGTAAASLLEAEIVTADGEIRIVNAARDAELFFALRGGGGGTFGVVTRVTLKTHDMPSTIGVVFGDIAAHSDNAYRALIARMVQFYAEALLNPYWGEQFAIRPDNVLRLSMMCQGLSQEEVEAVWAPFWAWVEERPEDYSVINPMVLVLEGRLLWDPSFLKTLPGIVATDDQAGTDQDRIYWASNKEESGQFLHGYASAWIPSAALEPDARALLADGLFEGSRHWAISLHTNKGLAGSPAAVRQQVLTETATNPVVTESFALAICGAHGGPSYPGIAGFEPDVAAAREHAQRIRSAMAILKRSAGARGAYVSESDFFETDWQDAFWGRNHARLKAAKARYDAENLFSVHHGILS